MRNKISFSEITTYWRAARGIHFTVTNVKQNTIMIWVRSDLYDVVMKDVTQSWCSSKILRLGSIYVVGDQAVVCFLFWQPDAFPADCTDQCTELWQQLLLQARKVHQSLPCRTRASVRNETSPRPEPNSWGGWGWDLYMIWIWYGYGCWYVYGMGMAMTCIWIRIWYGHVRGYGYDMDMIWICIWYGYDMDMIWIWYVYAVYSYLWMPPRPISPPPIMW